MASRKHITDAAWAALGVDAENARGWYERWHAGKGTMIVTVEEWEERGRYFTPHTLAERDAEIARLRDLVAPNPTPAQPKHANLIMLPSFDHRFGRGNDR